MPQTNHILKKYKKIENLRILPLETERCAQTNKYNKFNYGKDRKENRRYQPTTIIDKSRK